MNSTLKHIVVVTLLGFLVYSNALNGQFIWDDFYWVKYNQDIQSLSNIGAAFTRPAAEKGAESIFYRPIQTISYMVDYQLSGFNPIGYHITNIVLHILVALCVYWLIILLSAQPSIAFLASILYLIHPAHTEAVAYIAGRGESLAALFMLSTVIVYIQYTALKNIRAILIIAVSFTLALLSKEYSLITLPLLLLYGVVFKKKTANAGFALVAVISCLYVVMRLALYGVIPVSVQTDTPLLQRLPGFFVALANYIRIMIAPFDLHMEYGKPLFTYADYRAIIGMVVLCASLAWAFVRRKTDPLFFFSILWFYISLVPVANIYPINAYMAEHWLYVPSIGLFLIAARALHAVSRRDRTKYVGRCLIAGVLLFYSVSTIRQNNYWRDFVSFCTRTLVYAPASATIYNNLGNAYSDKGQYRQAVSAYQKALQLDPKLTGVNYNLADAYTALGEHSDAQAIRDKISALSGRK